MSSSAVINILGGFGSSCSKTPVSKLRHSLKCFFLLGQTGLSVVIIFAIAIRFRRQSC